MADEPLCFYCNEPRVALGCWSEDHTGIGLCGGHAKELGATFHHMEPTPESLKEIPEVDFTWRLQRFVLNAEKVPVPCEDITAWGAFMSSDEAVVGDTTIGDVRVSTTFLGLGARRSMRLFETMIFGGPEDGHQWRHRTWTEASLFHARVVENMTAAAGNSGVAALVEHLEGLGLKPHVVPFLPRDPGETASAKRLFRNLAEGWRKAHDDLGLGDLPEGYVLPMGLLAAANPYWQESVQQWKKLHAHTSRDTLFRRALYGGRKGRRALVRLGDSYEADRVRELHGIRPMRRRGERRRRVRCELEQLRARVLMERDRVRGGDGSKCKQENRWTPTRTLPNK